MSFRKLKIWQDARDLAVEIYRITMKKPFNTDFGLRDQIRKAAVSVPSNIAEGDERGTNPDSVRFFFIAKGSLAELQTQLEISALIGYLPPSVQIEMDQKCTRLGKMIRKLIQARSASSSASRYLVHMTSKEM